MSYKTLPVAPWPRTLEHELFPSERRALRRELIRPSEDGKEENAELPEERGQAYEAGDVHATPGGNRRESCHRETCGWLLHSFTGARVTWPGAGAPARRAPTDDAAGWVGAGGRCLS